MKRSLQLLLFFLLGLVATWSSAAGQDQPLGRSAAFGAQEAGPSVLVKPGTPIRSRPDSRAEALVIVDVEVELPVLERRGQWVRTHHDDCMGWLAPDGEPPSIEPEKAHPSHLVIDTKVADTAGRIADARSLLASENPGAQAVGPWRLYTDVRDTALIDRLDQIADRLPRAYRERFGLRPADAESRVVVLFADEADYRRFTDEFTDLGGLEGGGHADQVMAVLFTGEGSPDEVAANLVHELTHLLNRDLFEDSPQSWLEEGLASDLGLARTDGRGDIVPGTLGGETIMSRQRIASGLVVDSLRTGGQALWTQLLRDWRHNRAQILPLGKLLDLAWSDFVDDGHRVSNYAQSAFLVRFLLDDSGKDTARAFRRFLRSVAEGGASNATALAQALDSSVPDLQRRYERWLTQQAIHLRW